MSPVQISTHIFILFEKRFTSYVLTVSIFHLSSSLSPYIPYAHTYINVYTCVCMCVCVYTHTHTHTLFFSEAFESSCMPHVSSLLNTSMGISKSKYIFFCNINIVVRFWKFNIDPILFFNLYPASQYFQLSH